jgi:hypothetical protein
VHHMTKLIEWKPIRIEVLFFLALFNLSLTLY